MDTKIESKMTIQNDGVIFNDVTTIYALDGVEIGRKTNREVYVPSTDTSSIPENIMPFVRMLWTPEIVATHVSKVEG